MEGIGRSAVAAALGLAVAAARSTRARAGSSLNNGFSRGFEDQADRVGLRYAYEGGFDVEKAPALWLRFAEKYKDQGGVNNFLFGSHASSRERAKDMEAEVARNYAEGIGDTPSRPPVHARR